jgi:hypothetical protein
VKQWPDQKLTLRQGIMLISDILTRRTSDSPKAAYFIEVPAVAALIRNSRSVR